MCQIPSDMDLVRGGAVVTLHQVFLKIYYMRSHNLQGPRNGFWFGEANSKWFLENENFGLILFSEFQNFGEANATPVPRPLLISKFLYHLLF